MRDWDEVRRGYLEGENMGDLAKRFDIPLATIRSRASREGWREKRKEAEEARTLKQTELVRVGRKLLNRIESCLDEGKEIDLKELKAVTGALKELQGLQDGKDAERGESGKTLTVRFLGEAEEMSL